MNTEAGLEALFEYATEGILIANSDGIIMKANPSVERMFGYTEGKLLGQPVELLIPSKYAANHAGHRQNYQTKPRPRSMGIGLELYGKRKDGSEFPLEISLSPFVSKGNHFVIAFIIDITYRKAAEEKLKSYSVELEKQVEERTLILREAIDELEKTKEELNEALANEKELNDLKSRFVSLVSHEFRTPLAAALSSLSLVRQHGDRGNFEHQEKHIQRIKESIHGLTDILDDMLSISRIDEGKVPITTEDFNFNDFINKILADLRSLTKKGQQLLYTHTGETDAVQDKKIIKHILTNLISNAIKFSDEGKAVIITTEISNSVINISIKDYGIGISKEDQQHLFGRFFRGHNTANIQGTGLGLNIVAKYVEMMHGDINFVSVLNEGSTFNITLPQIASHEK
jgi:PAS domain S-box-containing protein